MRVGGDAGDIIDGDVGEDGRQVSVGKGNRQSDSSNRVNVNLGDYTRQERERGERENLSMGDRLRDLERTVYGDSRLGVTGVLGECRLIRETVTDIQKTVRQDDMNPSKSPFLWAVGLVVGLSALADLWNVIFR